MCVPTSTSSAGSNSWCNINSCSSFIPISTETGENQFNNTTFYNMLIKDSVCTTLISILLV